MTRTEAIRVINKMIHLYDYPTVWYMLVRRDLEMDSYMRWAIREVLNYVVQHPELPVTEAVEEFRFKMDHFACSAKKSLQSFVFSVAYDVSTDVLDNLLGGK